MQTTVTESDSERIELERLAFEAEQAAQMERHRRFFARSEQSRFVRERSFLAKEPMVEYAI